MDGNHPKRRKDKYNPYTIGTTGDGRHWLTFSYLRCLIPLSWTTSPI